MISNRHLFYCTHGYKPPRGGKKGRLLKGEGGKGRLPCSDMGSNIGKGMGSSNPGSDIGHSIKKQRISDHGSDMAMDKVISIDSIKYIHKCCTGCTVLQHFSGKQQTEVMYNSGHVLLPKHTTCLMAQEYHSKKIRDIDIPLEAKSWNCLGPTNIPEPVSWHADKGVQSAAMSAAFKAGKEYMRKHNLDFWTNDAVKAASHAAIDSKLQWVSGCNGYQEHPSGITDPYLRDLWEQLDDIKQTTN